MARNSYSVMKRYTFFYERIELTVGDIIKSQTYLNSEIVRRCFSQYLNAYTRYETVFCLSMHPINLFVSLSSAVRGNETR